MFRSWGEFRSCATDVFHLFADAPHRTEEPGLSRAGLECAFYVLLGRYPSSGLLSDCFATTNCTPSRSPRAAEQLDRSPSPATRSSAAASSGVELSSASGNRVGDGRLSLPAYLRFMTLCAEQEGPSLVASAGPAGTYSGTTDAGSGYDALPNAAVSQAATLQAWRQFESVAGPKGFITLADMSSLALQRLFEDVDAVLQASDAAVRLGSDAACCATSSAESSAEASRRRQRAVLQHVFWIMDRDRDGKVRFEDAKPYLLESAEAQ